MMLARVWRRHLVHKFQGKQVEPARVCFSSTSHDDQSPLRGIRVLDLTRIVAGPYCTMILGDLGAEVIKVEQPGAGDESRKWGSLFVNDSKETPFFVCLNRNKKSVCIDLKKGLDVVLELVKTSDVLVENYVPGKLATMGLSYDQLKDVAPHLVYCSITGYGSEGPYANRPGYDVIAASLGGFMHITGPKDGSPCKAGVAVTDLATGLYAHGAIMAALLQRMRTKKGQWIQCNLLSTQVASLINIGSNYLNVGKEASRGGSEHESIVPYEAFPTKDGYMTIGTGSDAQFQDLLKRLDLLELINVDKYKTNNNRVKNRDELCKILRAKLKEKTNEEWNEDFRGSVFPYGQINNLKQVFDDPHIKHIKLVKEIDHPVTGKIKVVGPPVTYSYAENAVRLPPPMLGQHTYEVLKEIYSDEDLKKFKDNKDVPTVRLRLRKPRSDKKVQWTQGTVDNENMNKKKSKCCCIYEKPKKFGESSSEESDDECEHCHGRKDAHKKPQPTNKDEPPGDAIPSHPEPIATGGSA